MKKFKTRNVILCCSIIAVLCYTITNLIVACVFGVIVSDTLTRCWFGFWTVELFSLSTITNTKVKNKYYIEEGVKDEY